MERFALDADSSEFGSRTTRILARFETSARDESLLELGILARDCARAGVTAPVQSLLAKLKNLSALAPASTCNWVGHALLLDDQVAATDWFVRAMQKAREREDLPLARASGACALMSDLLGLSRHPEIPRIAEAFTSLVPNDPGEVEPQRPLLLLGRLCAAYVNRSLPLTRDEIESSLVLLQLALGIPGCWPTAGLRTTAATVLVDFAGAFIDLERARDIAFATSSVVADAPCPRLRGLWWSERAWLYASDSDSPVFQLCLQRVEEHAAETDNDSLRFAALRLRCAGALRAGLVDEGMALLPAFEQLSRVSNTEALELSRLKAAILIMGGRGPQALEIASAALRLARASNAVGKGDLVTLEMEHAHALAAVGDVAGAANEMRVLAAGEYGTARDRLLSYAMVYEWQISTEDSEPKLLAALERASASNAFQLLPRDRATLSRMCDEALQRDIEPDFVRRLIAHRRVDPPPYATDRWPWAVRIETLGGFRLSIRGAPYRPEHKAQDKVLELLKVLVAAHLLRRGEAERGWICEQLWSEADDDAKARKSLETTVARLRRLLQEDASVLVSEGRVRLNQQLVWSDAMAFVAACSRIKSAQDAALVGRSACARELRVDMAGLLSLYNGPFLQGDTESPWLLSARAQTSRLLRQSLLAFAQVDADAHPRDLLLVLERAHVVDPGSEEIAQMLMRHHLEQESYVEALRVYRTTRDRISAELGTAPSPQTEALGRKVFQAVERDAAASAVTRH